MRHREPFEDDGRTVADMSGLYDERPHFLRRKPDADPSGQPVQYTRKERLWAMFGAAKAVLVIAGAYLIGLASLLVILFLIWK